MKYRVGFVTNSSSSSYICVICNEEYSGWDASISDAEMYQCENGHTFCESHVDQDVLNKMVVEFLEKELSTKKANGEDTSETEKMLEQAKAGDEDVVNKILSEFDLRDEFPAAYCPVCTFKHLTDEDAVKYLLKKFALKREDV